LRTYFRRYLLRRSVFPPENRDQFFVQMDNSMRRDGDRTADEFRRLKILRVLHPPYSPGTSACDFWTFGDFKGKLKERHPHGPEEILMEFQDLWDKIVFEELQMVFES
jgi:hypothetical protein